MKEIFCFGSNLSGIHGAGAAKKAYLDHGAIWNTGAGLHGDSYALPTKGYNISFMPLDIVALYVERFLLFALAHPELQFKVTRVGCGLAGFKDNEIAPLFKDAPENCMFDTAWEPWLGETVHYWGTF